MKEVMISCCTEEVIEDDIDLCPKCKEHMGLEPCPDCDGTGVVLIDEKDFAVKRHGLQHEAEMIYEQMKYVD